MSILAFSSTGILDSTAAGRAMLTAEDITAQRVLLGLGSAAFASVLDFDSSGAASAAVSSHAAVTSGVHGISGFISTLLDDTDLATAQATLGLGSSNTPQFLRIGIGSAAVSSTGIVVAPTTLSGSQQFGLTCSPVFTSSATTFAAGFFTQPTLASSSFTCPLLAGYRVTNPPAFSGGAAATILAGVSIDDLTRGATNAGIYSNVSSGSGKWGWYGAGTADNLTNGAWVLGSKAAPTLGADQCALYSSDFAAGNACPTFKTENGTVIQLNQSLTTTSTPQFATLGVGTAATSVSGITCSPTGLTGTIQIGLNAQPIASTSATDYAVGLLSKPRLASGSFTCSVLTGLLIDNPPAFSGGATATILSGVHILDQTRGVTNVGIYSGISNGSNKWGWYGIGTADNLTNGAWVLGSKAAPTLSADQCALYSSDFAAGNACPTFKTENGTTIQLNQSLTTTDTAQFLRMGVGTPSVSSAGITCSPSLSGTNQFGVACSPIFSAGATTQAASFFTIPNLASGSFTCALLSGLRVNNPAAFSGGAVATILAAVTIEDLTRGVSNYGVYANLSSGSNKWGWYGLGTANNLTNGSWVFGSSAAPTLSTDQAALHGIDAAAGNRCIGWATENGQTGKLYQQAFIAAPSGGATIDSQARTAIDSIRTLLINNGLMAAA